MSLLSFPFLHTLKCQSDLPKDKQLQDQVVFLGLWVLVTLCKDGVLLHAFLRSCLLPLEAEVCEVRGKSLATILPCIAIRGVCCFGGLGPGLSLLQIKHPGTVAEILLSSKSLWP